MLPRVTNRPDTLRSPARRHVRWRISRAACSVSAAACIGTAQVPLTSEAHYLVPAPASARLSETDSFAISRATAIHAGSEDEAAMVATYLAELLGKPFGTEPRVLVTSGRAPRGSISLTLDAAAGFGAEGYELTVAPDGIRAVATEPAGLFYAVQTLRQLLPADVERSDTTVRRLLVPLAHVVDQPRFEWRGAMLDVSRHFLRPADVKRYIDHMALYKLNRLHLHLSDDQGWRIEIKSWPNLTAHGGSTQVDGGPGGYYTQEEYADIVRYAHGRFITVVPEIDMPGHTNAALASYPELNCNNVAPPLYTGTRVGFSTLCVQKDVTYRFIDDVVREITALTPGPYFHIGGDEVERLTADQYARFIQRVAGIVRTHGKRMIGWGEIASVPLDSSTIIQHWQLRGSPRAAVERGSKVILSPANKIYLDMKYDSTTRLGFRWAGFIEVRDAYDWEPATFREGVPEESILGVEGPLWSETVATISEFEYLAFPRLAAVAEIGWTPAERRTWDDFRVRLGAQAPRWRALGINFYPSPQVPWR